MKSETKWLLGVTIASLFSASVLALIVWGILQAFGGFASYVDTWPLFIMFPISVTLSVLGLWLARKNRSRQARWLGYVFNGAALVVPSLILFFVGDIFIHMDRARYIVPEGYQGYVYILHGFANGVPEEKGHWEVTYRIPSDGVLVSQAPEAEGFRGARYYYGLNDGSLKRIPAVDLSVPGRESGIVAFPKIPETNGYAEASETSNCNVRYEWFHIGHGSNDVAAPPPQDLAAWLHAHGICANSSK